MIPSWLEPGGYLRPQGSSFTDLLVAHAPNAWFLRTALEADHRIPGWNPLPEGGLPFLADPTTGVWYPPSWLAVLWPSGMGFSIILWLHLSWAGWGMWRLLRAMGAGEAGSWAAALAFSGSPKLLAQMGLGHLGLVCGLCWAPHILFAVRRAALSRRGSLREQVEAHAPLGVTFGFATLADPRASLLVALVAGPYYLVLGLGPGGLFRSGLADLGRRVGGAFAALLVAGGLSAALWIPLAEYVQQSTRSNLSPAGSIELSLPPGDLLQTIVPGAAVSGEWVTYVGLTCLVLAAVALALPIAERWFWGGAVLLASVLALGDGTPFYRLLAEIVPGMSWTRVPARLLFVAAVGWAVLAGLGLDRLLEGAISSSHARRIVALLSMLLVPSILLNAYLAANPGNGAVPYLEAILAVILGVALFALAAASLARRAPARALRTGWIALVLLDLAVFTFPRLATTSAEAARRQGGEIAAYLAPRLKGTRVLSLSYLIPSWTGYRYGLRMGDGVHPLPLRSYWARMAKALSFDPGAYSVVLPPLPGEELRAAWPSPMDIEELSRLNIGWIVTASPLEDRRLSLEAVLRGAFIYSNPEVRPRAWVQLDGQWGGTIERSARVIELGPDRIQVSAQGPGTLVLAEPFYPGWRARINGTFVPIGTSGELWRAVALPSGSHEVLFEFTPQSAGLGAILTLATCLGLFLLRRTQA